MLRTFRGGLIKQLNLQRMFSDITRDPNEITTEQPKKTKTKDDESFKLPPEPDNCCMSGCENCVWIQYAKDLTDMYKDSGETARKILLEKIKDPTMQVFLRMELSAIEKLENLKS